MAMTAGSSTEKPSPPPVRLDHRFLPLNRFIGRCSPSPAPRGRGGWFASGRAAPGDHLVQHVDPPVDFPTPVPIFLKRSRRDHSSTASSAFSNSRAAAWSSSRRGEGVPARVAERTIPSTGFRDPDAQSALGDRDGSRRPRTRPIPRRPALRARGRRRPTPPSDRFQNAPLVATPARDAKSSGPALPLAPRSSSGPRAACSYLQEQQLILAGLWRRSSPRPPARPCVRTASRRIRPDPGELVLRQQPQQLPPSSSVSSMVLARFPCPITPLEGVCEPRNAVGSASPSSPTIASRRGVPFPGRKGYSWSATPVVSRVSRRCRGSSIAKARRRRWGRSVR